MRLVERVCQGVGYGYTIVGHVDSGMYGLGGIRERGFNEMYEIC